MLKFSLLAYAATCIFVSNVVAVRTSLRSEALGVDETVIEVTMPPNLLNPPVAAPVAAPVGPPTVPGFACPTSIPTAPRLIKTGSTCGGPNQARCNILSPAEYIGKSANIVVCPAGTFIDIGAGGCYRCPVGYQRSTTHVNNADACFSWEYSSSTLITHMSCGNWPGSFFDPIDGGTCWTCPAGYGRTWDSVKSGTACSTGWFGATSPATLKGSNVWACPAGSFFDPNGKCYSCPAGSERTVDHVESASACRKRKDSYAERVKDLQCDMGSFFDLIDGGTCWRCPLGFQRTWDSVKSGTACSNLVMDWSTAREDIGLFNIPGIKELLWWGFRSSDPMIPDVSLFKEILDGTNLFLQNNKITGASAKELINEMRTDPANSMLLKNALMIRLYTFLNKGENLYGISPESCAAGWLAGFTRSTRMWLATEAEKMMNSWKEAQSKYSKGIVAAFGSGADAPPFTAMAQNSLPRSAGLGLTAIGISCAGVTTTLQTGAFFHFVQPFAHNVYHVAGAGQKLSQAITTAVAASRAGATSVSAFVSAAAGPVTIALSAVLIGAERLTTIIQNEQTFAEVTKAVEESKRPCSTYDLSLAVKKDAQEFATMFHRAASGPSPVDFVSNTWIFRIVTQLSSQYP